VTGVLEHGYARVGHEGQQVVSEHSGWLDSVVVSREHQDRHVDVGKTGRDVVR
jgi:hypothetical protein